MAGGFSMPINVHDSIIHERNTRKMHTNCDDRIIYVRFWFYKAKIPDAWEHIWWWKQLVRTTYGLLFSYPKSCRGGRNNANRRGCDPSIKKRSGERIPNETWIFAESQGGRGSSSQGSNWCHHGRKRPWRPEVDFFLFLVKQRTQRSLLFPLTTPPAKFKDLCHLPPRWIAPKGQERVAWAMHRGGFGAVWPWKTSLLNPAHVSKKPQIPLFPANWTLSWLIGEKW